VSGRKVIKKTSARKFNEQRYGQGPPLLVPVSNVSRFSSSNTLTPYRRKQDPTHRNTRSHENLTFGRNPEGELAEGIDPDNYEDPWRFKHRLQHHHHHHQLVSLTIVL
jgi:hypothetical protein